MEAILKYDLNDMDEKESFLKASRADNMHIVLWEIIHNVKKRTENQYQEGKDYYDGIENCFNEIRELIEHHQISDLIYG
jgi:hypothetical protein